MVVHYNATMGGVDRMDANVAQCRSSIRGKKWYFPIFIQLVDTVVNNSWLLYRLQQKYVDLNSFKSSVAESLLNESQSKKKTSAKIPSSARYDSIGHLVVYSEKERRCAQCQNKTKYACKKCEKSLHPKDCFLSYHTK